LNPKEFPRNTIASIAGRFAISHQTVTSWAGPSSICEYLEMCSRCAWGNPPTRAPACW
jgi:hypothetical protein